MKKTVIIGASTNPERYAYLAAHKLKQSNHEIVPIGIKQGEVAGEAILDLRQYPEIEEVDTVTLYIGSRNQEEWQDYILSLNPKRIIFNPGTENTAFTQKAKEKNIETLNACTLVMLGARTY